MSVCRKQTRSVFPSFHIYFSWLASSQGVVRVSLDFVFYKPLPSGGEVPKKCTILSGKRLERNVINNGLVLLIKAYKKWWIKHLMVSNLMAI